MNLDLNKLMEKLQENNFVKNFIKELSNYMEKDKDNTIINENIDNIELTQDEDLEFYRKKWDFLENFFDAELSDSSNNEIFIVTDKIENDYEYHRYKITQYKDNKEYKYVAFEKDLPKNVQLGDIIRKKDAKYTLDIKATEYVKESINRLKKDIISKRK